MAILNTLYSGQGVSSSGGTITGDLTISGDLTVTGDSSGAYSEIITGDMYIKSTTEGAADAGAGLRLFTNDGTTMESGDRLGFIEFAGAEDSSDNITVGARIEALTDDQWSATENGADMVFYTTDGNASQTEVMRLTADAGMTIGADGAGHDVVFHSGTGSDNFTWDASEECLIITGTDGAQSLKVADGDLVVVDLSLIHI